MARSRARFKRSNLMKNNCIFIFVLLVFSLHLAAFTKAVWVTSWDLTSREKIDQLIKDCKDNDIDQILAEIRYRGDALYFPNRKDSTFANREPRSYLLADSDNFDPLAYLIKKAKNTGIEIHAWITVFVVTPRKIELLSEDHLYFLHPEWFTSDFNGKRMDPDSYEGAYLDPGVPEVHLHLLNLIMDIIRNYQLDGIHFDYIRYPDISFGYNKIARTYYQFEYKYRDSDNWQLWKENQVSNFLKKMKISINNMNPEIVVSAAVFPQLATAVSKYAQNWYEWLSKGYIDKIYLMAYTTSNDDLEKLLNQISNLRLNDKIVVGLKAWDSSKKYKVDDINFKIKLSKKLKFAGISLFSYSGIRNNDYFKNIKF